MPRHKAEQLVGKVYTTHFAKFTELLYMMPNAMFLAVTRTWGFKRGAGTSAVQRRTCIKWVKVLSPSTNLHQMAVRHRVTWEDFKTRYLAEMTRKEQVDAIDEIAHCVAAGKDVVLMCYEAPGEKCHRTLLADLIVARVKELRSEWRNGSPVGGEIARSLPPQTKTELNHFV